MIIIHDKNIPEKAAETLRQYGDCVPFFTEGITHKAIAGHPDIFLCPVGNTLIAAPNTPPSFLTQLKKKGCSIVVGVNDIGDRKENSTHYNAVITDRYIIHNRKYTDPGILEYAEGREFIHVNQGYTRCSLLPLGEEYYLTSDKGIEKRLLQHGLNCYYVDNREILLPGVAYGCIGGCMGIFQQQLFVIGTLQSMPGGHAIKEHLTTLGYEVIELCNGNLYDGGSLFFFDSFL